MLSDLLHVGDTQHKTYRIQYIALSRSVQTCDRVKGGIPPRYLSADWIRLETCQPTMVIMVMVIMVIMVIDCDESQAGGLCFYVPSSTSSSMRMVDA